MPDETPERSTRPSLALPGGIILIVGTLLGIYVFPPPLKTSRPPEETGQPRKTGAEQSIQARLWQDPFAAVYAYCGDSCSKSTAPRDESDQLAGQIRKRVDNRQEDRTAVLILPVMVEGGSYAEAAECRQRYRYAVLTALAVAGYQPTYNEHIGFVHVPWRTDADSFKQSLCKVSPHPLRDVFVALAGKLGISPPSESDNSAGSPASDTFSLHVPFEWLQLTPRMPAQERLPREALVLWLDEDRFANYPLTRLVYLIGKLGTRHGGKVENWRQKIDVRVLGPATSSTLAAMRQDALLPGVSGRTSCDEPWKTWLSGGQDPLTIYSSLATAPEAFIARGVTASDRETRTSNWEARTSTGWELVGDAEWRFVPPEKAKAGIRVFRTGGTDDKLAEQLFQELHGRGIDLTDSQNHVALISEWDTFYGRTLPLTFADCVQRKCQSRSPSASQHVPEPDAHDIPQWIHRYSYLRGIDGLSAGKRTEEAKTGKPDTERIVKLGPNVLERADGTSQFDYMRRITWQLEKLDKDLDHGRTGRLRAIGVLGSDVYDKLLIMRALRDRFPSVVFFTTDLDCRLFHQEELRWTCNLIVASHFGLRLKSDAGFREERFYVPPFRSAYQTSLFESCLVATGQIQNDWKRAKPRLFEIGRNGECDISLAQDGDIHPPRAGPPSGWWFLSKGPLLTAVVAGAAFLLLMVRPTSGPPPLESRQEGHQHSRQRRDQHGGQRSRQRMQLHRMSRKRTANTRKYKQGDRFKEAYWTRRDEQLDRNSECLWRRRWILGVSAATASALLISLIFFDHWRPEGEPFALFDGTSAWPTAAIWLIVVFVCVYFFVSSSHRLYEDEVDLAATYHLSFPRCPPGMGWVSRLMPRLGKGPTLSFWHWLLAPPSSRIIPARSHWRRFQKFWYRIRRRSIGHWEQWVRPKDVRELWLQYLQWGTMRNRIWRVVPASVVYLLLAYSFISLLDGTPTPYRGDVSRWVVKITGWASGITLVVLTLFVVDATRLCNVFGRKLAGEETPWPEDIRRNLAKSHGIHAQDIGDWLDVRLIAKQTAVVGRFIIYPFVALSIMVLAQQPVFERWPQPIAKVICYATILLYAVACAITLRRSAEKARRNAVESLTEKLLIAKASPEAESRAAQLEIIIRRVQSTDEGAFGSWSSNPILEAVLIPMGSVGLISLLEYFAKVSQ